MKFRMGFVSNSSSSSYIVALAVVKDKKKAQEWLHSVLDIADPIARDVNIFRIGDSEKVWDFSFRDGVAEVDGFNETAVLCGLTPDDEVLVANISNNEGDTGRFAYDEEAGEIDYNIGIEYFDGWQRELYEGLTKEHGFGEVDVRFGAARNG